MAPKKKEQQQKMSLGDFLTDSGFGGGSWADEVEETYVAGYSVRERSPARIPDKPPFTAHLGNLSYDATNDTLGEFFEGCEVVSVRIIEDRELMRPKGFGYVEFANVDGLKKALELDGESFQGRMIKIKVADPPRGGDSRGESSRDLSDWTRKGPLPELPGRSGGRQMSDFGERRPRDPAFEGRPERPAARELNWERRGPLAPLPQEAPAPRDSSASGAGPDGLGERGGSHRGPRGGAGAWGEGRQEGSRPPRRDLPEPRERVVTAAEKDMQWRDRMRPDAGKPESTSHDGSEAPPSPALSNAAPAAPVGRPRLNLQKRTVSEATDAVATPSGDSKASPFGAARPIDTAAREKEIEEKRQQAIREKREADDKAKEERRLAKQAAAAKAETEEGDAPQEETPKEGEEKAAESKEDEPAAETQNGASGEAKVPIRTREAKEPVPAAKPRPAEAGNWRSASNEQRRGSAGGPRGGRGGGAPRGGRGEPRSPRTNGSPASPDAEAAPATDEDGWTTVPNKKGRQGRPLAS
ncbi:RNA recognition motif containing protein [Purpureocillium lavendulum]|uniref:RNA recognition motif containing protein n=1 Tax=Purpureocillium lavendulum TaxID=1247861 RepID=A0AB34FT65_9HYPO|nr:RNA recognition motif containing protein [Purpureocillium lavendulum]